MALNLKKENEIIKTVALQTLTASHTEDITALETLTASHTTDITALETLTASHTADILTKLDVIQDGDILEAGTGIDITKNVISSTSSSSFAGFRAVTAQGADINVGLNTVIPFNSVSVNTFAYDTQNMFDTTAS